MPVVSHREVFAGKRVLVTGHTGFKGSWLCLWLAGLGARVTGLALEPPTEPSNFVLADVASTLDGHVIGDVRDADVVRRVIAETQPEVIFHLAAQTVVRVGYRAPVETFDVNTVGTSVLLEVLRSTGVRCACVVVTSDKCYLDDGSGRRYVETDPLGGDDPYSASKACQELVTAAFRRSYFPPAGIRDHGVALATARAGNVIGGGDWTPDGLIADVARSVLEGRPVALRAPAAVRPWQHVLEPLNGYLTLATALLGPEAAKAARAWNFGPVAEDDATVIDVVSAFLARWGSGSVIDGSRPDDPHEAPALRLSDAAARSLLGWHSRWRLAEAIDHTVDWWRRYASDATSARSACLDDISAYDGAAA
jgi:CDP-glucose 4,6-dehydratase